MTLAVIRSSVPQFPPPPEGKEEHFASSQDCREKPTEGSGYGTRLWQAANQELVTTSWSRGSGSKSQSARVAAHRAGKKRPRASPGAGDPHPVCVVSPAGHLLKPGEAGCLSEGRFGKRMRHTGQHRNGKELPKRRD